MAKPATEARIAAAAKGFTSVVGRRDNGITTYNPETKKFALDCQVGGGWHYNGDQETDTAWTAGVAPWNYQMTKALYNAYALSNFSNGQIIKWVDPGTGQYVAFQPMALQWTNNLNQIQQISMPQSVAAQASDDILYWPAAYGSGRNFRYHASPLRLNKQLIIDSPSALPTTTYDTLELNFIIAVSSGVNIMVDGVACDKKSTKDKANAIAFQLPGGAVLWSFAVPTAYDSSGLPEGSITGSMRLKKQGNSLYVSVRFPKVWIDSIPQANYPIVFDPTVDYQVGGSDNDGLAFSYNSQLIKNGNICWGKTSSGYSYSMYLLFSGVTIPTGATITTSYITFVYFGEVGTGASGRLYFEKAASPVIPSSYANYYAKTRSTNYVTVTRGAGTWNSSSINAIVQEVVDAYDYSDGSTILVLIDQNTASNNNYYHPNSYDNDAAKACSIHIEYTEAAAGGSLVIPSHRRRFQALLVR